MTKSIIVKNVTKVFSGKVVLEDINFSVDTKEVFGIIGASGSGKTTLLKMMIGYETPDEGDIQFAHLHLLDAKKSEYFSIHNKGDDVRRTFGYAAQEPSFYPKLTVVENMEYFAALYGLSRSNTMTNVNTLLDLLDMQDCKRSLAENLSGGMQKRLDIACALVHDPQILILDEPTADLDPVLRKHMWSLIKRINKRGTTIIIASHFLEDVEAICDNVVMLHDTRVVHSGNPKSIKQTLSKTEEIIIETAPGNYEKMKDEVEKLKHVKISSVQIDNGRLIIKTTQAETVLHDLLHLLEKTNESLVDLFVAKPTLNEVFEAMEKK